MVRKSGLRRNLTTVASVEVRTGEVWTDGSRVTVGTLQAELDSPSDARWLSNLFALDTRPSLRTIAGITLTFLRAKSEAYSLMTRLQEKPRLVLLESFAKDPEGAKTVAAIMADSENRLSAGMDRLLEEVDNASTEFPEELRGMLYASLYAVCLFQDSSLREDQDLRSAGLRLLAEASSVECPAPEALEAAGIDEACRELLDRSLAGLAANRVAMPADHP